MPNSDVYLGMVGMSWLWGAVSTLTTPVNSSAAQLAGKVGVGLNWVATSAELFDLYNNRDQAGTGDIAKFGVDGVLTEDTTAIYIYECSTGVGLILTGIQVVNTLGWLDPIYESFNKPMHGGGGSW